MTRDRDLPDEANRYDGAPAPDLSPTDRGVAPPSAEEAARMHRERLADLGCRKCGEDDPDVLDEYVPEMPRCSAVQAPAGDPRVVLCDEHSDVLKSLPEKALSAAERAQDSEYRDDPAAVAFYDCGGYKLISRPDGPPVPGSQAKAPIECRCGDHLDRVARLAELAAECNADEDDGND